MIKSKGKRIDHISVWVTIVFLLSVITCQLVSCGNSTRIKIIADHYYTETVLSPRTMIIAGDTICVQLDVTNGVDPTTSTWTYVTIRPIDSVSQYVSHAVYYRRAVVIKIK